MPSDAGGVILRLLTAVAGLSLLAVTTDYSISAGVGYDHPWSRVMIAMAIVAAIGAAAFGHLWSHGKRGLAVLLCAVLLVIEVTAFVTTAERVVTQRDAQQSPALAAAEMRRKVTDQVAQAEAALRAIPETSGRLSAAIAQKAAADTAAIEKAAERGCAANCRALLEQQVSAAGREVDLAREDLAEQRRRAQQALDVARANLAALPPAKAASALSDRLGVSGWLWDLAMGAMNSIATNVGACVMIAVAAHWPRAPRTVSVETAVARRKDEEDVKAEPIPQQPVEVATLEAIEEPRTKSSALVPHAPVDPFEHVDEFAFETIKPKPRGSVTVVQAHRAYLTWCRSRNVAPVDPGDFAETLGKLIKGAGLKVRQTDDGPVICGVRLETRSLEAA